MASSKKQNAQSIDLFLGPDPPLAKLYGDEVHLFMHCHMRGYDRTGEGLNLDGSFFDKYGAPIHLQDFWMEGYHAIERMLADHFVSTDNPYVKFPPVAGYAGGTHLYGVGTDHADKPWNWTGWIPRWKQHRVVDAKHPQGRPLCNRFFMAFRGNEIQNDYWDYHPCADPEGGMDGLEEDEETPTQINNDKYRGGYFYRGNSWARYLHINTIKSHERDTSVSPSLFKRYNYIVHPLAYRINMNRKPDNTVDGIQWAIMNIVNEPHFGNPMEWGEKCNGLEIFNDFTYYHSYNPEYQYTPFENPDFPIPCHNGELMNTLEEEADSYVWWFDTYPLEYAEFLLDTALSRGIHLHPLASNDASYNRQTPLADFQAQLLEHDSNLRMNRDTAEEDALRADPKGVTVKRLDKKMLEKLGHVKTEDEAYKRKSKKREGAEDDEAEHLKDASNFVNKLPYKDDTAFGYTTLIDPKHELKKLVCEFETNNGHSLDDAEMRAMDYLIEGRHFSHLGVYGLFDYHECDEKFPILIEGQPNMDRPCYQMTDDMELIFTFMNCKSEHSSSFTDAPKDFVWKYAIQLVVDDENEETIHGYFSLDDEKKTRLDLSNYDKRKMKWIRFTCFEPASPQQRAWFIPIKGMSFGKPRNLMPRRAVEDNIDEVPKMRHHIASIEEVEVVEETQEVDEEDKETAGETMQVQCRILKQSETYFDKVFAVESKDLKFLFDSCSEREEKNIYVYFLQVNANQQDLEQLKEIIPDIENVNDSVLPPRILQSVHGFLELNENYPTRLDLSNSWDKETVITSSICVDGEEVDVGQVVYFYAIDTETFSPIEIDPKPHPIMPEYDAETAISSITKLDHESWLGAA